MFILACVFACTRAGARLCASARERERVCCVGVDRQECLADAICPKIVISGQNVVQSVVSPPQAWSHRPKSVAPANGRIACRSHRNELVGISSAFIMIALCFAWLQDRPIRTCPALV